MNSDRILTMVRGVVTPLDDTLSVHLAAPPRSELRPVAHAERRWRALGARMRERGVDDQTVNAIWTPVRSAAAIRTGVAVFARAGRVVYVQRMPDWDGTDLATFGAPAHVAPVLGWLRTLVPYVVVVTDRTGAEIIGLTDSGHPLAAIRVIAPAAIAEHCLRVAGSIGATLIVAVGAAPDLPYTPGVEFVRVPDGPAEDRLARIGDAVRRHAARREHVLLERFDNLRGPAGIAVEGMSETLAALAGGYVTTLLVSGGLHEHPSAWFADPPDAVALNPAEVFEHHRAVRRGPLTDVAIRAALLAGADVCVLPPDTVGAPDEGLGALCRLDRAVQTRGTVIPIARLASSRIPRRGSRRLVRGVSEPPRR